MLQRVLGLLFVFLISSLHADLEDYFKIPQDKKGFHGMRNIDYIYMINLDKRPEKFTSCERELTPYGIFPYRFSAVNGWELSVDTIIDLGVKYERWMTGDHWGTYYSHDEDTPFKHEIVHVLGRKYFCHCMARGAIGCVLSHLSVLQDAYESGYETIWVMEDDIEIIENPHILSDLIDDLDELVGRDGWDILFTDIDTKSNDGRRIPCSAYAWRPNFTPSNPYKFAERYDISDDLRKIGARYGTYSMIVRRSGMKKLLQFFKNYHLFLPYDMELTQPEGIRLFSTTFDVVSTQMGAPSDNGNANYKKPANEE